MQWIFFLYTEAHADDIQEHYRGIKKYLEFQSVTFKVGPRLRFGWLVVGHYTTHGRSGIGEATDVFVSPLPQLALPDV